ncbi:MAG: hypothetical protein AAFN93_12485, partial [Bacteroidota bacterium]
QKFLRAVCCNFLIMLLKITTYSSQEFLDKQAAQFRSQALLQGDIHPRICRIHQQTAQTFPTL